jgi:hypothetical protein
MAGSRKQSGPSTGRTVSRRRFLARSAAAGTVAWAAPTIISLSGGRAWAQVYPEPGPGQPSIEVEKTANQSSRVGTTVNVGGIITIRNVSSGATAVIIETITDRVEYRIRGGGWQNAPTSIISLPCPPGTSIPTGGTCSGPYSVQATVPTEATAMRNVVEVRVFFRDRTFLFREDVTFSAD